MEWNKVCTRFTDTVGYWFVGQLFTDVYDSILIVCVVLACICLCVLSTLCVYNIYIGCPVDLLKYVGATSVKAPEEIVSA